MKKSLLTLAAGSLLAALPASGATVIAFWDFNDGFDVADESVQIVHNASIGSGTIYQQRADTDGNGKGGNAFSQSGFDGSPSSISVLDGKSMAWDDVAKSGDNDAEIFITFITTGFQNIEISFDIEGNDDAGILTYDVKYDFNDLVDVTDPGDVTGTTIKDFDGGISTSFLNNTPAPSGINDPEAFARETIVFGSALDDQTFVAVRLDDFEDNDAMSIDNLLVTGSAVPEPESFGAIAGLLVLGLAVSRRRRS